MKDKMVVQAHNLLVDDTYLAYATLKRDKELHFVEQRYHDHSIHAFITPNPQHFRTIHVCLHPYNSFSPHRLQHARAIDDDVPLLWVSWQ